MIITISGDSGSGKSTVAKAVAEKLGYKFYSIGDFMGEIALEKGISLLELSKLAEKDRKIDEALDSKQIELGKKKSDFVIDSRLGWHFIPGSIKIYLSVNTNEAVKRIFSVKREDEKENISLSQTKKNIITRKESEKKRYMAYYGVDYFDESNYDFVIDTTNIPAKKVAERIVKFVKDFT
jgi:cytidylate kinase